LVNERVLRFRELVVINEQGENLGAMDARSALKLAHAADLDLVIVNPNARPAVAKILDYGKWQYEQEKREKDSAKKPRASELKAVRFRPGTNRHDLEVKLRNALRFLGDGHKVKVTVMLRSREITRPEVAREALHRFAEAAGERAVIEREPKMEGRFVVMILSPKGPGSHGGQRKAAS
jgi:translation initiation factor IF-3